MSSFFFKKFFLVGLFSILLAFVPNSSKATHVFGAELSGEFLSDSQYVFTLVFYRDCNGIFSYNSRLFLSDGIDTLRPTLHTLGSEDITNLSTRYGIGSRCSGSYQYGLQKHLLTSDTIDLRSLSGCNLIASWTECCRSSSLTTLYSSSSTQNFYIDLKINKCLKANNSTPKFLGTASPIIRVDDLIELLNVGVDTIDFDDSLTFEFDTALVLAGVNATYVWQFKAHAPLTFHDFPNFNSTLPNGFHLDQNTGSLKFTPDNVNEIFTVVIKMKEWVQDSSGAWGVASEVKRDFAHIVVSAPSSNSTDGPYLDESNHKEICVGDTLRWYITATDPDASDSIFLSANGLMSGATITKTSGVSTRDTLLITWVPDTSDVRSNPYHFEVVAKDNGFPLVIGQRKLYHVRVGADPKFDLNVSIDSCGIVSYEMDLKQSTFEDVNYNLLFQEAGTNDTALLATSPEGYAHLDSGTYYIKAHVFNNLSCEQYQYDTLYVASSYDLRVNLTADTGVCTGLGIELNTTVSGGQSPFDYRWSNAANAQGDSLQLTISRDTSLMVTVSDGSGCYHRDTIAIESYPLPDPLFTTDTVSVCLGDNNLTFTDTGSIAYGSYSSFWRFGDGDTSSGNQVSKSYSLADTFAVRHIATSNYGCLDSLDKNLIIRPQANPYIYVNDTGQCYSGHEFSVFADSSTISHESIAAYYWDLGDTSTGTGLNQTGITYNSYGDRTITLVTETSSGCFDTTNQLLSIYPHPIPAFQFNAQVQCFENNSFIANASSSTIPSGMISNYEWYWGDGATDTGSTTATKTYAGYDTFEVKLRTTSLLGCADSTYLNAITLPNPHADFTRSDTQLCFGGNQFTFNASGSSVIYGGMGSYEWYYSDGDSATGLQVNKSFSAFDTAEVMLIARTAFGCPDTLSKSVIIHPQSNLVINFNDSGQCLNLNSFDMDATSSSNPWGSIVSYRWELGDGDTALGTSVQNKQYANAGFYAVELHTVSDFGCRDSLTEQVQLFPRAQLYISHTSPRTRCLVDNYFDMHANYSAVNNGSISNYYWDFGDGTDLDSSVFAHAEYTYADTFTVMLVTTTDQGCLDSLTTTVGTWPHPQTVIESDTTDICLTGNSFDFDGSATQVDNGFISTYEWNFANGKAAYSADPNPTDYNKEGTYQVRLITRSNLGCKDTAYHPITVHAQMKPAINVLDSFVCATNNEFDLSAASSTIPIGTIADYRWSFSDGSSDTGITLLSKQFATYDTFTVRLDLTSAFGCRDSLEKELYVFPEPVADFSVSDSIQCYDIRQSFSFDASSSYIPNNWSQLVRYDWFYDDSTIDVGAQAKPKKFASRQVHDIRLVVTTLEGCRDTLTRQIAYYPPASLDILINADSQCFNEHDIVLSAENSSVPYMGFSAYDWLYSDGLQDTGEVTSFRRFASIGEHGVRLVTTSDELCYDTLSLDFFIAESPVADFSVDEICFPGPTVYHDLSTVSTSSITEWEWDFGDGNVDNVQAPIHQYGNFGVYTVGLEVTTDEGCSHDTSFSDIALVHQPPVAAFGYSMKEHTIDAVEYAFTDSSFKAFNWQWHFGDGKSAATQNADNWYQDTGLYLVNLYVEDTVGCWDSASEFVRVMPPHVMHIPNAFTPNKDILNEGYSPVVTSYYRSYKMLIFNRRGEVIFKAGHHTESWDGKRGGKEVPDGIYFYHIEVIDYYGVEHEYKGSIHLLR